MLYFRLSLARRAVSASFVLFEMTDGRKGLLRHRMIPRTV